MKLAINPIVFLFFINSALAQVSVKINSVNQLSYGNPVSVPNSDKGAIEFSYYNSPSGNPKFLNIMARPISSTKGVWIAQNIPLINFPDTQTWTLIFSFNDLGYSGPSSPITQTFMNISISDGIYTTAPVAGPTAYQPYTVSAATIGNLNNTGLGSSILFNVVKGPISDREPRWVKDSTISKIYYGCNIPNQDLDANGYNDLGGENSTVPEYNGDDLGCGPASGSNAMTWLAAKDTILKKLFAKAFGTDTLAQRRLMAVLSNLMKKKLSGTDGIDIIGGLLHFIDSLKIPVHVKFQTAGKDPNIPAGGVLSPDNRYGHKADNQSNPIDTTQKNMNTGVSFDWIKSEMEKGEAVILNLTYFKADSSGNAVPNGGHSVIVTGAAKYAGNQVLVIKEDRDQSKRGGNRGQTVTGMERDSVFLGAWRIKEMDHRKYGYAYISSAISMSSDSNIKFNLSEKISADFTNPEIIKQSSGNDSFGFIRGICGFQLNQMQQNKHLYAHLKIALENNTGLPPIVIPNLPVPENTQNFKSKITANLPETWKPYIFKLDKDTPIIKYSFKIFITPQPLDTPFAIPFSGSPAKERESIIQQTIWKYDNIKGERKSEKRDSIRQNINLNFSKTDLPSVPFSSSGKIPYSKTTDVNSDTVKNSIVQISDAFLKLYEEINRDKKPIEYNSLKPDFRQFTNYYIYKDSLRVKEYLKGLTKVAEVKKIPLYIQFQSQDIRDAEIVPDGSTNTKIRAINQSNSNSNVNFKNHISFNFISDALKNNKEVLIHVSRWKPYGKDSIRFVNGSMIKVAEAFTHFGGQSLRVIYDEKPNMVGGVTDEWIFVSDSLFPGYLSIPNWTASTNGTSKKGILKEMTMIQNVIAFSLDTNLFASIPQKFSHKGVSFKILGNPSDEGFKSKIYLQTQWGLDNAEIKVYSASGQLINSIKPDKIMAGQHYYELKEIIGNNHLQSGIYYLNLSANKINQTLKLVIY